MNPPKQLKDWDPRPWPINGDNNIDITYSAVGRALSSWERYEGVLSLLFSAYVTGMEREGARRAYSAVRTFEARMEMLAAASEAYFHEKPNSPLLDQQKEVLRLGKSFSPRRNEIAHGVVDYFSAKGAAGFRQPGQGFALFPSYATFICNVQGS